MIRRLHPSCIKSIKDLSCPIGGLSSHLDDRRKFLKIKTKKTVLFDFWHTANAPEISGKILNRIQANLFWKRVTRGRSRGV